MKQKFWFSFVEIAQKLKKKRQKNDLLTNFYQSNIIKR